MADRGRYESNRRSGATMKDNKMKAGKELDDKMATDVMGWERGSSFGIDDDDGWWLYLGNGKWQQMGFGGKGFRPSTQIADAMLVLEKLEELGWKWRMKKNNIILWRPEWVTNNLAQSRACLEATGETLSHAICLAALETLNGSE